MTNKPKTISHRKKIPNRARAGRNIKDEVIIAGCKRTEDKLTKHIKILQEINKYSMELPFLQYDEMFPHIVKKLKAIFNVRAAWVCEYDEKTSDLVIKSTSLKDEENSWVMKKLRSKIPGYRVHVDEEQYRMMTNNMVGSPSSLHELSFGAIPEIVGKSVENLFGIGWFLPVTMRDKEKIKGTVVIAGDSSQETPDREEILAFADITASMLERKLAEHMLQLSEKQYRSLTENSPDLIARFDRQYRYLYVNESAAKAGPYSPEEYVGKTIEEVGVPEQDAPKWVKCISKAFETGQVVDVEDTFKTPNGLKYFNIKFVPEYDIDGSIKSVQSNARDITERGRAEDALYESEEKYRVLFESIPVSTALTTEDGRVLAGNGAFLKLTGCSPDEMASINVREMYRDPSRRDAMVDEIKKNGFVRGFEAEMLKKNGIPYIAVLNVARTHIGGINVLLTTAVDITAQRNMWSALFKSEERFRHITESLMDYMYTVRIENGRAVETVHGTACKAVTGYTADEFISNPDLWLQMVPECDREIVRVHAEQILSGAPSSVLEHRITHKDGAIRWVRSQHVPNFDSYGRFISYDGFISDITERKRAVDKLASSEVQYRRLFETAGDGILILDADTGIVNDANQFILDHLGYHIYEILGKKIWELGLFSDKVISQEAFEELKRNRYIRYENIPLQTKDGRVCFVEFISNVYPVNDRDVIQCNIRDITERRLVEDALAVSEEKFARAFRFYPAATTISMVEDGLLLEVNESFEKLTGYSRDEAVGRTAAEIGLWADLKDRFDCMQVLLTEGRVHQKEYKFRQKNGCLFTGSYSAGKIEIGNEICVLEHIADLTDRMKAENEIKRLNHYIIQLQEKERQKVSKDLHDGVGQTILAAKLNIETYKKEPGLYGDRLDTGIRFLDEASQELREIYMNLYPLILSDLGLEAAVRWYAKNSLESNGITTHLNFNIQRNISHDLNVVFYRIIQEIFANILKHSRATMARIDFYSDGDEIVMAVEDNGAGFLLDEASNKKAAYGLTNIRHRASSLGGTCTINSRPGQGTKITIIIKENDGHE